MPKPPPGVSIFTLCRSDTGDGGWSLHSPLASDAEIADGTAVPLISGPAEWDAALGDWDRPNADDYAAAAEELGRGAAP